LTELYSLFMKKKKKKKKIK